MDYKMPYYMAYPMPLQYDDERMERRDLEYMKSMYPDVAKRLLPYVEDECDRMEYEGSMMYDEYPDQLQLRLMCKRVHDRVKDRDDMQMPDMAEDSMVSDSRRHERMMRENDMQNPGMPDGSEPDETMQELLEIQQYGMRKRPRRNDWLQDLIQIMMFQEIYKRRCDYRRCRSRYYMGGR